MAYDDRDLDGLMGRALHALSGAAGEAEGERLVADEPAATPRVSEEAVLPLVGHYLSCGLDLKRWWERAWPERRFAERFELGRTFNEASDSFGFFDTVDVAGEPMPVMGNYQEMFYDRPKSPAGDRREAVEWIRKQMRRFVLRYFMRVSDFRAPRGYTDTWRPPLSNLMSLLSWCPQEADERRGFGFQQLWYKERGGPIRPFPDQQAYAIVDLEELGRRYEWIVVKVRIFDFDLTLEPLGPGGPRLSLPLQEDSYLVLSGDFVEAEDHPEPGVVGRYGLGYSFIRDPRPSLLGYGPGRFDAAIELIDFHVFEDGTVRVPMVFVANRPERVMNLEVDPMGWGMEMGLRMVDLSTFGTAARILGPVRRLADALPRPRLELDPVLGYTAAANLMSSDMAGEYLCIRREQLEKDFLVKHYMQHYQAIAGSLATWRQVADWCDEAHLPSWVTEGRQS